MPQRGHRRAFEDHGLVNAARAVFDGSPDKPYLWWGMLLAAMATILYLFAMLVGVGSIAGSGFGYMDDPSEIMARVRSATMLVAVINTGAVLLAIPGVTFVVMGIVQFHHACRVNVGKTVE